MSPWTIITGTYDKSESESSSQWFQDEEKTKSVPVSVNLDTLITGEKYNETMCLY